MSRDEELREYLTRSGVEWGELDRSARYEAERAWRALDGRALRHRPRLREGAKSEYAYQQEQWASFLIVPFTSDVDELPVKAAGQLLAAYECRGPLVALGEF